MIDLNEIRELFAMGLFELVCQSHMIHLQHHKAGEIQICQLISVKTFGCPENCKYCSQSIFNNALKEAVFLNYGEVLNLAKNAIANGATRICLGAAWRNVRNNAQFEQILKMIQSIKEAGAEVCCTLGMISEEMALKLKNAGVYAYNHNLDSSENYYPEVVTTRTYQERLETLKIIQACGISLCCGGILGLGENIEDRIELLHTLSNLDPYPSSVPVNMLQPIKGSPYEHNSNVPYWEFLRFIAVARIVMPKALIRLSAGRLYLSDVEQTLCFFAGANSIHTGEKLLTVETKSSANDVELFKILGLTPRPSYV